MHKPELSGMVADEIHTLDNGIEICQKSALYSNDAHSFGNGNNIRIMQYID